MSTTQRTVTAALWVLVVASLLALLLLYKLQDRAEAQQNRDGQSIQLADGKLVFPTTGPVRPVGYAAPGFALIDQTAQPFDSKSLAGKVYTVSFFFSRCEGICPGMMTKIQSLAKVTTDPRVEFVYLTVDPTRDTPERLAEYGAEAKADPKRWHMLTGADEEMKRLGREFKLPYTVPAEHSGQIVLVDQGGIVRGYYNQADPDAMLKLAGDVQKLLAGESIQ